MEIGISTASLFMRENTEDAVLTISALGSKITEIFFETYPEYALDYAKALKPRLSGTKVHSVHVYTLHYEPELFSDNPRSYGVAEETYRQVLESAKYLGAKNYTMHGRARIKKPGSYDDYEKIGKRLEKLSQIAAEYGVALCLENVEWALYNRVGYLSEVVKYAPNLRATFDIKQARLSGYDYYEYIEEMKGRINTVHLSDIDRGGRMCLPGENGTTDFRGLFNALFSAGFDGGALLEVYKDDYKDTNELKESLKYLENIKNKIRRQ